MHGFHSRLRDLYLFFLFYKTIRIYNLIKLDLGKGRRNSFQWCTGQGARLFFSIFDIRISNFF